MLQVLVAISQKFCCRKEACGYAKVIHKKEKKRKKKMKKWYSDARLKKEEKMNKMAHVSVQICFQVSKERYVF